ncbi:MAG: EcsC family protein [Deltaproteobacteria bacterium]|jgi:hypothetical protein|nr:EcsC family protein [Deltaproteobacteria bacterium]MBT4525032.1 EcsC family protein [Deltaproteobacteria bacterium]
MIETQNLSPEEKEAIKLLGQVLNVGINGMATFSSSKKIADRYLNNKKYPTQLDKINALVRIELTKNFTTGFLTSLGGIFTLPFTIPASLAANWVIQTRMVAAMAYIGGFNIDDPPVRVSIALCLLGKKGKQALHGDYKDFQKLLRKDHIAKLSKQTIQMLNLVIANRLMKLSAQKGLTRLGKAIPIIGGALGGVLDYYSCKNSSEFAMELFDLKTKNDIIN